MLATLRRWIAWLLAWLRSFFQPEPIQGEPVMSALSIEVPFPVFYDRDGQPLENGYVWIGQPNLPPQTNPVNVYFDKALTILAPQPLRTINGYISRDGSPAQVYIDGVNFSILVQDSKGSTVYNFPEGTGISQNADGVVYNPSGTGAIVRTVQTKLREFVSAKDFGAVGNGVADDTAAFQNAIDAVGDGVLYIPPGRYKITSGLTISGSLVIDGGSPWASLIIPIGAFDVFTFTGGSMGAGIRNLGFDAVGVTGGACIVVSGADRLGFTNIIMTNPWEAFRITHCNVCSIRQVWVNAIRGRYGIKYHGGASTRCDVLDIDNCQFSGSQSPATATSPVGILIDGNAHTCSIRHFAMVNGLHGLLVQNTGDVIAPEFVTAYDLQVDYPYSDGIKVYADYRVIRSIFLTDVYVHGSIAGHGVFIENDVQHVSIQSAKITNCFSHGIYIGGRYVHVANCNIANNSQQGVGVHAGVRIDGQSIGVSLTGNLIGQWVGCSTEKQSYGVLIESGAQAYAVIGNNLRNNVLGDYKDNAADATSIIFGNNTSTDTYSRVLPRLASISGDLELYGAGTAAVALGSTDHGRAFAAQPTGPNSVNYLKAYGNPTGSSPVLEAVGQDSNINLTLKPKGDGRLQYKKSAIPTSDVPITGYIEILDNSGNVVKLAVIS